MWQHQFLCMALSKHVVFASECPRSRSATSFQLDMFIYVTVTVPIPVPVELCEGTYFSFMVFTLT